MESGNCTGSIWWPRVLALGLGGAAMAWCSGLVADEPDPVLQRARSAMASRDLPGAKAALNEAAAREGAAATAAERERLAQVYEYLFQFWTAVDQGARSLQGAEELVIGNERVAFVEYANQVLVLRVAGENRRYSLPSMPAAVALAMAQRALRSDTPQGKALTGVFLLVDPRGDRQLGARLLHEAQQAGVPLAAILPEFQGGAAAPQGGAAAPQVGAAGPAAERPIQIPPLPPAMRTNLKPDNWLIRRVDNGVGEREPLARQGRQDAKGHLQITLGASDSATAIVLFSRRLGANFLCRCILQDVGEGQTFGLFPAGLGEGSLEVPLPPGTVTVELARYVGQLKCQVNGEETAIESKGNALETMAAMLGTRLPSGGSCTISWLELRVQ